MVCGGHRLRALREQLGLTMRDVETATMRIAQRHQNDEYLIAPSRLSDMETKNVVPSIYRLYSLAVVYRRDVRELLAWYEIDLNGAAADMEFVPPPKSHLAGVLVGLSAVQIPIKLDPSFDERKTTNIGRMVEAWGMVPLAYLAQFASCNYTYGYVGSEDLTMYPILPPGTFVQIDESKNKVEEGGWRSEYERPIYFVETRRGHTCCWCTLAEEAIILTPHPLSPVAAQALRYPQEADVIGQVVGVAMKLGSWRSAVEPVASSTVREVLN